MKSKMSTNVENVNYRECLLWKQKYCTNRNVNQACMWSSRHQYGQVDKLVYQNVLADSGKPLYTAKRVDTNPVLPQTNFCLHLTIFI